MDGHVGFVKYPGEYPVTHYMSHEHLTAHKSAGVDVQVYLDANEGVSPL